MMHRTDGYLLGCLAAAALFAMTWGDREPMLVAFPLIVMVCWRAVKPALGMR